MIPLVARKIFKELSLEGEFIITPEVLDQYQELYIENTGTKGRKLSKSNREYNRKIAALNLVKIKRELGLKIKEGFIYIIENPAWPNMYKIGMTIDTEERLNSYQTYSPKRDYKIRGYRFVQDRRVAEKELHKLLESERQLGEWFELPDVSIFLEKINLIIDR